MASVDVKWPSEDEDFDATTGSAKTATEKEPVTTNSAEAPAENTPSEPAPPSEEPTTETRAEDTAKPSEPATTAEPVPSQAAMPAAAATTVGGSNQSPRSGRNTAVVRTFLELILLVVVVLLALWGFTLQSKNKNLQKQVGTLNANPAIQEQRKTNDLVNKVGALMELPTGEQPQAALVSDATSLKKQYPFFSSVQNGDQILFYFKAGKVIVYRPSTNKIVQTGPLSVNTQGTAATNSGTGTNSTTSSTTGR